MMVVVLIASITIFRHNKMITVDRVVGRKQGIKESTQLPGLKVGVGLTVLRRSHILSALWFSSGVLSNLDLINMQFRNPFDDAGMRYASFRAQFHLPRRTHSKLHYYVPYAICMQTTSHLIIAQHSYSNCITL